MKRFLLCSVKSVKVVLACLLALAFVSYGSLALADYEVTDYTADSPPPSETPTQWTNDVTVQWEAPSFSDPYTLVKFVYKWTTSESALNYTQLNADDSSTYTPNGGIVEKDVTPYHADLSSEEIAGDDYNVLRYLHLKTVYINTNTIEISHSNDKVIGPFNIDNVVTGTLRLHDPDDPDEDLQETRQTQITVEVGYPGDVAENGLYLNETSTRPSQGLPYTTTTYTLQNTDPGSKTIYAWFQDQAGNISSTPEAASFTLLEQVSIDPNTATIDLAVTDTRTFQVAGTSDGYTWTVINEIPETAGENVADLTGTTANVNSVTLQGLNPGTCQLTAQSGSTVLTSGTITVKGIAFNLDIDDDGSVTALGDGVLIVRYLFGFTGDTLITGAYNPSGNRNTASAIQTYLADGQSANALDIDDDGSVTALGDGVLIVRYLFGFTGDTLITGAYNPSGNRNTASAIQTYLLSIMP